MAKQNNRTEVPIWDKLYLSIPEASAYSGISVSNIRKMIEFPDCDFLFAPPSKGKKILINRKSFENYILNH